MFNRITALIINIFVLSAVLLFPQAGTYYNTINTSSSSFITDVASRIRSPYTQISYDQFDETNIANFASRDTTGGKKVVTCVYSSDNYMYTPPFTWAVFSREHTWCQSWMPSGGTTSSQEGSDQHHLFPVNQNSANGVRSNHPLGNVVNVTGTFKDAKIGTNSAGKIVYEPRPSQKGDAARALFYMAVRYNGIGGYDWSFNKLQTYLASHSEGPEDVATLLSWAKQDPPDKWEIDRNNYIQSIQKNRNPFVDHPEWINYINFNDLTKLSPVYAAEPTNYATNFTAGSSGSAINVNWTDAAAGTQVPSGYLLIAYDYNNYFLPIDGESYTNDADLSDGKAVVNIAYNDPDTYSFSGLTSNKRYYFVLFSYNGTGTSINYRIEDGFPSANAVYNGTAILEPTVQASNVNFTGVTSTSMTVNFTAGNGSNRIVLVHAGSAVNADPVDGVSYTSHSIYGSGTQIGTGNYVVYNSTNGSVVVTGLTPGTVYYYKVYEFNGSSGSENYLQTSPAAGNISTGSVVRPTVQASLLSFSSVGSSEMTLKWTNGNGTSRIVLGKLGSAVDGVPVDGASYTDASAFGTGTQIGTGNYVIFKGPDSTVTVTGLTPNTTYYFSVFEYDGPDSLQQYLTTAPASGSMSTTETSHLIISEVYGGGGNSSATYKNDFIVIYNPSNIAVDLTGWSVQYASAGGASFSGKTNLSGTIYPQFFYVIQEASGGATGAVLPYIDLSGGTINLSATAGRVALSRSTSTVTGKNDPNVVDYVGFGSTAIEFEGSSYAPPGSNSTSIRRKLNGTQDSDDNSNDFATNTLGSNPPLPVELNSFTSSVSGRSVALTWTTETEKNSSFFEVQRSLQNADWITIGKVNAHGTSSKPYDYSFSDKNLQSGKYSYRLKMVDNNGSFEYSKIISSEMLIPVKTELLQNYPNPFNPMTVISYSLPEVSNIRLVVYDAIGREVKELIKGQVQPGYYDVTFNGSNIASGLYFYELTSESPSGTFRLVKKFILMK